MNNKEKFKSALHNHPLRIFLVFFVFILIGSNIFPQNLPLGYISYFSDKCNHKSFFTSWDTDKPDQWRIISLKNGSVLSGIAEDSLISSYIPETRGILSEMIFGDFILEFEFKVLQKSSSDSAGFYFLGPVRSSLNYYTVAFTTDTIMFFFVDDSMTNRIASKAISIHKYDWNKVRIKRDILLRQLHITVNNKVSDKIIFTDRNLVMGYIGFGTHQMTSYLKNINVWAPTAIIDTTFLW